MPSGMTNGMAATLTAKAVSSAMKKTALYFAENPYASKDQVGIFLNSSMKQEMAIFGGSMTKTPPWSIPSPAPYLISVYETTCL